jgi:Hypothetical protein (DUF2513)
MKLDPNILRETLFNIEELPFGAEVRMKEFVQNDRLMHFNNFEIAYCCETLYDSGFINAIRIESKTYRDLYVKSLTFHGHQLLDEIRNDTTWNKVKQQFGKATSASVPTLLKTIIEKTYS